MDVMPETIVVWEKDGKRRWMDFNDPVMQLILKSPTALIGKPKRCIYTKYVPNKSEKTEE